MSTPAVPRLSASLLVLREEPLEILMVRRKSGGTFSSALVFPGGIVEPEDSASHWRDHVIGFDAYEPQERAVRIAAMREAYEEAGLLQFADDVQIDTSASREAQPFIEAVRRSGRKLDLESLVHCGHWITPEFMARRFDTHFFLLAARGDQGLSSDGQETIALEWRTPAAVIDSEKDLPAATRANLEYLAEAASVSAALIAARDRPRTTVLPRLETRADGDYLVIDAPGMQRKERKMPAEK